MTKPYNPLTTPNAVDMLQTHFSDFHCSLGLSRVCFYHHISESACGGDEVDPVPFAFAIFSQQFVECALFSRVNGVVAFYGVFNTPYEALEFLIDHFDIAVYFGNECAIDNLVANFPAQSPLDVDENHLNLPTESVDN